MNAEKAEILVRWYLRFNGYFTVENFIVHNPEIVSKDHISNMTEIDVLGIRNCFSHEIAGQLHIANDPLLIGTHKTRIDFIIGEVKTGKEDKPNKIWRDKKINAISYLLRFAGFIETADELNAVARVLSDKGIYIHSGNQYSVRLVLFSENGANKNWKHLTQISLEHIIDFILETRGQCWIESGIGVASIHNQWDQLINSVFQVANDQTVDMADRKNKIQGLLT
ncbi:MAG: hypothetical protein B7Y37_08925 [Sphingobacteriia bacterium 28-36-52]|nr:MAG: hypothetical protein B7Y37_08925 [Sphingobacteriia bacterium 28-36-52]